VVEQLIREGEIVRVIVRSAEKVPASWKKSKQVNIVEASILNINDLQMTELMKDCTAVVSCLGHNISLKGIYGKPRKLVTRAVQKLTAAVMARRPIIPMKFILMNTAGNSNRDLNEHIPLSQKLAVGLIRLLVPPHADNEMAADYLRKNIGHNNKFIEWVVVRPDDLTHEKDVTEYELHPSPIRNPIFNAGKTSRTNVAHFITRLITQNDTWRNWKGKMPVIYNKSSMKITKPIMQQSAVEQ
jgi:hypothetical protein